MTEAGRGCGDFGGVVAYQVVARLLLARRRWQRMDVVMGREVRRIAA